MPALTITAVNAGTDQLTIAAHGLNTGDGPGTIYTPNGTIPAGLAPVTDVYAIRVDANTIKLATSSANALLGTAIDITSAGSGTLQLLVGLPYRRPRTAVAGSQIMPADDNATWDSIVALWNFLTGQTQSVFTDITLPPNANINLSGTGILKTGARWLDFPVFGGDYANGVYAGAGVPVVKYTTTGGTNFYSFPIHGLKVGTKIWQTRARIQDSATGPTTLKCRGRTSLDGAGATFGDSTPVASLGNGTAQTIQSDNSGAAPFVTITSSGINIAVEVFFASGSAACSIFRVGLLVSED